MARTSRSDENPEDQTSGSKIEAAMPKRDERELNAEGDTDGDGQANTPFYGEVAHASEPEDKGALPKGADGGEDRAPGAEGEDVPNYAKPATAAGAGDNPARTPDEERVGAPPRFQRITEGLEKLGWDLDDVASIVFLDRGRVRFAHANHDERTLQFGEPAQG